MNHPLHLARRCGVWARTARQAAMGLALLAGVASSQAAPVIGQGTWQTTMAGRDINGTPVPASSSNAVFLYDSVLNLTWLRNANVQGPMLWPAAQAWASSLVVGGFGGWRLPTMLDVGNDGCAAGAGSNSLGGTDCGYNVLTTAGNVVYSEMASLFQDTLGNKYYCSTTGICPQPGWGLSNTADFQNLTSLAYWTGLSYAPDPANRAWYFRTDVGGQTGGFKNRVELLAMAVRPGDVAAAAVPEPGTGWLLAAAFGALVWLRRPMRAAATSAPSKAPHVARPSA